MDKANFTPNQEHIINVLLRKNSKLDERILRKAWGMVSNGLAMTPERYTRLLNAGLKSLTISLDGLESNHNHFRGSPLTAFQEKYNVKKSRTRCRIEHVFGWVKGNHELFVRTIGKARAEAKILASFLTYNMYRMVALTRPKWA